VLAVLAVLVVLLSACSDKHTEAEYSLADDGNDPRLVYVLAPSSLTPMLEALATELVKTHPDISLVLVAGHPTSKTVATSTPDARVKAGARPSIWIDTSPTIKTMRDDPAVKAPPIDLGADALQFVVMSGNPEGVKDLSVFGPQPGPKTALCDPKTPCGRASTALLNKQGIESKPDRISSDGAQLLRDLGDGKVAAGIVYATDAAPSGLALTSLPYPGQATNTLAYQMVRFTDKQSTVDFATWIQTAPEARTILDRFGLLLPAPDAKP
jgi:molybdate transport system substrate-binding protein